MDYPLASTVPVKRRTAAESGEERRKAAKSGEKRRWPMLVLQREDTEPTMMMVDQN